MGGPLGPPRDGRTPDHTRLPQPYPRLAWHERALDLLFPPTCVQCRRVGRWICPRCWAAIDWRLEDSCGSCFRPWLGDPCAICLGEESALESISAPARFDGAAREAVHVLKYYGKHAIAPVLARVMAARAPDEAIDLVVPVSLHRSRRRERGFDQAELLARGVARTLDVPVSPDIVRRTRRTAQQVGLDQAARRRNVAGAFEASAPLDGETVLLIDDVITTGATMQAAAQALRDAGASGVHGLAFAAAPGLDAPEREGRRA